MYSVQVFSVKSLLPRCTINQGQSTISTACFVRRIEYFPELLSFDNSVTLIYLL